MDNIRIAIGGSQIKNSGVVQDLVMALRRAGADITVDWGRAGLPNDQDRALGLVGTTVEVVVCAAPVVMAEVQKVAETNVASDRWHVISELSQHTERQTYVDVHATQEDQTLAQSMLVSSVEAATQLFAAPALDRAALGFNLAMAVCAASELCDAANVPFRDAVSLVFNGGTEEDMGRLLNPDMTTQHQIARSTPPVPQPTPLVKDMSRQEIAEMISQGVVAPTKQPIEVVTDRQKAPLIPATGITQSACIEGFTEMARAIQHSSLEELKGNNELRAEMAMLTKWFDRLTA